MNKLALTLAAAMAIAITSTGCGSDSTLPITYISRAQSDNTPHLFTLAGPTATPTAVSIPIPTETWFVASNSNGTAVTYGRSDNAGEDLFLMGTDGTEKPLTTDGESVDSVFSPDGKTIAYVSLANDNDQIFIMNADGSNPKALYAPTSDTAYAYFPEFSPDGKSVVFFVEVTNGPAVRTHGPAIAHPAAWPHIQKDRSKNQIRTVTRNSSHPQVAGLSDSGWYTMALTDTVPTLVYAASDVWGPAVFSANGKSLLLTLEGQDTPWNISSVNLDGTGLTALTTSTDQPDFSPVPYKSQILYNRYNNDTGSFDIYVMDQTGANQTLVHSTASTYESLLDAYYSND
jgi:Tol biopolymer transport system component